MARPCWSAGQEESSSCLFTGWNSDFRLAFWWCSQVGPQKIRLPVFNWTQRCVTMPECLKIHTHDAQSPPPQWATLGCTVGRRTDGCFNHPTHRNMWLISTSVSLPPSHTPHPSAAPHLLPLQSPFGDTGCSCWTFILNRCDALFVCYSRLFRFLYLFIYLFFR